MPLTIATRQKKTTNAILLAFSRERQQTELLKQTAGLSYVPEIPLGAKEITQFMHPTENRRVWVLGLGDEADAAKSFNFFRSVLVQQRQKMAVELTVIADHFTDQEVANAVLGLKLGMINHGTFRTNGSKFVEPDVTLVLDKKRHPIANAAMEVAEAQISAMMLVDQPSNKKIPAFLADHAKKTGKEAGIDVQVLDAKELRKKGLHALLAVGQGSMYEPLLIVLEYKGHRVKGSRPDLGLVGKGITFDTGGISIKPSANMANMKSDMAGAAAVMGAIDAAARLKLPLHLIGIIPVAENSVDAHSIRPGDVISSYSGKSIEVIDTDAEGRLILADGLAYMIKNYNPKEIIDLATLTGSCIASLGNVAAGMFTNNDAMARSLTEAGEKAHEKVWRLPLWDEYMPEMHSEIADIKNLSTKPVAGAITAAKFLEFFTEKHTSWTHLDIAGVAFTESEFAKARTATGYGVRLLLNYMQHLSATDKQSAANLKKK